jgi:hypothetical protein
MEGDATFDGVLDGVLSMRAGNSARTHSKALTRLSIGMLKDVYE